jgi:hypothetical protein
LKQRRKANRKYQECRAAKLDHAARQRAYIQRQNQKVTGQGREGVTPSVKIDSDLKSTNSSEQKARQGAYAEPKLFPSSQESNSGLVICIVCGRSALWSAPFPRST